MSELLTRPVTDRSAWKAADLERDDSWIVRLTRRDNEEIAAAFGCPGGHRDPPADARRRDLALTEVGAKLLSIRQELEHGRGVILLRGLDIEGRSVAELEALLLGLARHIGSPIVQNTEGDLVDQVRDRGLSFGDIRIRGYATCARLTPHCDSGDLVGLLCVRAAKQGGTSTIASFASVHNEILAFRPALLPPLYRGFHYNIRGCGPLGPGHDVTLHRVPVYVWHRDRLSGRFNAKAIRTAEELPGMAPLTPDEHEAIDRVESLALREDLRFDMDLRPGDVQLLCNHAVLHTREAFVDDPDPARKRLLLRIWINVPGGRELPAEFDDHYNTGPRRGPFVHRPRSVAADGESAAQEPYEARARGR